MSRELPPGVVADLDQFFAEADRKYMELVEVLRKCTDQEGMYEAAAIMAMSLSDAPKDTLTSMVVTGLRMYMLHGGNNDVKDEGVGFP